MSYCECDLDERPRATILLFGSLSRATNCKISLRTTILLFGSLSQATNCKINPRTTILLFGCETSRAMNCEISPQTTILLFGYKHKRRNGKFDFQIWTTKIDRQKNETLDAA